MGFCRDELYETNEEAEMMLDEAEEGEEGQGSPPYVAPGVRSPSPTTLAAEYTQVQGVSDLSTATLASLERGRQSMEEVHRMAYRTRMVRERERRNNEAREERSRSRSRSRLGRPEQQMRGEEERRRCKSATTWNPPGEEGASVTSSASSASEPVKEDPIRFGQE